jgi:glycosyltransferase involved in cell wall biosynthesis
MTPPSVQAPLRVAVVLVSYRHSRFIRAALDGLRAQSRVPDEVVIADDGSPDDTAAVIRDYVTEHRLANRWTLLLSERNRGINANLQGAIDRTTADIIVPMAGDDISLPNRCAEAERAFLANPGVSIITTAGWVIDDRGDTLREMARGDGVVGDPRSAIRRGYPPFAPIGQSWRRSLFERFGPLPSDVPNEDDQISFWGLLTGGIACVSTKTFRYRLHDASASAWLRKQQSSAEFYERFVRDMGIRERHMRHWQRCLEQSGRPEAHELASLAARKAEYYVWLQRVEQRPLRERLSFCLRQWDITTLRDRVYVIGGRSGVLGWRTLRHVLRRA